MEKVTEIQQYKDLVKEIKGKFGRLDTNCMSGSRGMETPISKGTVSCETVPGGILFYVDEGMYLRLYYHLGKGAMFPRLTAPKPVLLEEPDNCDRRKEYLDGLFARAGGQGFEKVALNLMVSRNPAAEKDAVKEQYLSACRRIEENGFCVTDCMPGMEDDVLDLWKNHLKTTDIPEEHLNFSGDETQRVVCAVDREGHVKGVNWWQIRGRNCEIRHTVTAPDSYKKGIGYALVMAALADAADMGCSNAFTYISDVNYRSLGMYSKAGMAVNGKVSYQYMLKEQ